MEKKPLASIFMATYNHAAFIRKALEACLAQKTSFPFEIVVCDDASTDGTTEIVKEYAAKYPHIVHSLQKRNTGGHKNFFEGMQKMRGKYVAFCEGDDFWTSPHKLERQVRFLEDNPDFSVCCHKVRVLDMANQDSKDIQYIYKDQSFDEERIKEGIFYADEAMNNYYFQTSSVVFRWRFTKGFPSWFHPNMLLDHFLFMLHAVEGKIKYFDDDMSVWRRQSGGYSWLQTVNKGLFFQKEYKDWIFHYEQMDEFFSFRFTLQIRERILLALRNLISYYVQTNQLEHIRHIYKTYKDYFKKPVLENAAILDGLRLAMPQEREFFLPWTHKKEEADDDLCSSKSKKPRSSLGGSLGLDIQAIPKTEGNVWDIWTAGQEYAHFASANQALAAWIWHCGQAKIWLPHYRPNTLRELCTEMRLEPNYYTVGEKLEPSPDFLASLDPGHIIITFAYFGKGLPTAFEEALAKRKDIFWIEDRRQALWTGKPSKANAVLYSPKDVLGVPDGALLVGEGLSSLQPKAKSISEENFFEQLRLSLTRLEEGKSPHPFEQNKIEGKRYLPTTACSQLSIDMLKRIPLQDLVTKRQANWAYLYKHLGDYALWKEPKPDFAPFVFPIKVPKEHAVKLPIGVLLTLLNNQEIYCSPSWQMHQNPPYTLSTETVLLPCDHLCDEEGLERMVSLVKRYLQGDIKKEDVTAW